ncbi:MAG TPA: NADPH:quinone reductase [Chloroflexota bacterium]|nr:NADPH:quinone reductase [Chloroflexota bacterium]
MRAAWYERKGPARDVLQVGELETPVPGPGEVRVRIHASGVNPSDTKNRSGWRGNVAMPFPRIIPHQDGAGVIDQVGDGVPAARVGERVWVYEAQLGRPFGTAAEYVVVPSPNAVRLPDSTSFAEGACLGVPALTAHYAVFADGAVAGKRVLVAGGAGAVGGYAIQLAKWGDATVIATVSSAEKAAVARALGADHVINYREEDVVERVRAWTSGAGVHRVIEVALGVNLPIDVALLEPGGTIAAYSSDAEPEPRVPFSTLLRKNAALRFVYVYGMGQAAHDAAIADVMRCLEANALRHIIHGHFSLDEIAAAHEAVESGTAVGKVVLDLA